MQLDVYDCKCVIGVILKKMEMIYTNKQEMEMERDIFREKNVK